MRVVIDSSVLVAAAIARAGVCATLLEDVLAAHELVLSVFICDEVERVLFEKFSFPAAQAKELREFWERVATVVEPQAVPAGACRDPDDLPILGTALAAAAAVLVTVDRDLLDLGVYQGIAIIRPAGFWGMQGGQ
jgi:putative PIN family toxin of toxin-antitoxin system